MSEGYRGRHSWPESSGEDASTGLPDVEREAKRAMLGWDETPMISVPVRDAAAAAVFPRRAVLKRNVESRFATARRAVHAAVFLAACVALALSFTFGVTAVLPTGLEDEGWIDPAVGMILLLALLVIAGVDAATVATWEMYAVAGVFAFVFGVATGNSVVDIVLELSILGGAAHVVRRSRSARRVRWQRLGQVVADHRLIEADVVHDEWSPPGRGVHLLRVVLASPEFPGVRWRVHLRFSTGDEMDAVPTTGDRMLLFVCPADPEVAVARPVLAGARGD